MSQLIKKQKTIKQKNKNKKQVSNLEKSNLANSGKMLDCIEAKMDDGGQNVPG